MSLSAFVLIVTFVILMMNYVLLIYVMGMINFMKLICYVL